MHLTRGFPIPWSLLVMLEGRTPRGDAMCNRRRWISAVLDNQGYRRRLMRKKKEKSKQTGAFERVSVGVEMRARWEL